MLPVNGIPVIDYSIRQLKRAGVSEIGIVIHASQPSIREHLGSGDRHGVSITYLQQQETRGLADAIRSGRSFLGGDSFLVMLGDNLIEGPVEALRTAVEMEGAHGAIMLARVENPRQFGVAVVEQGRVVDLEEKPEHPRSDLAIAGAYAFRTGVWLHIDRLRPSRRGEYELTDVLQMMIGQTEKIVYSLLDTPFFDVGTPEQWIAANRHLMAEDGSRNVIADGVDLEGTVLIPPVRIGKGATIRNSRLGPFVTVGESCRLEACTIDNSIILEQAELAHLYALNSAFGAMSRINAPLATNKPARFIIGDKSSIIE